MLILNYSHPFSTEQRTQLTRLLGSEPELCEIPTHVDRTRPLAEVAVELVNAAGLTAEQWQNVPLALNPPALAPLAVALIAELHGLCGYFLPLVHVRPVAGALPPRYEIAEIVALQDMRDRARARRY